MNEKDKIIYFSGNNNDCKQRHLYCASFAENSSADLSTITTTDGWHSAIVNSKYNIVADLFCSIETPIVFNIYKLLENKSLELIVVVVDNSTSNLLERDVRTKNNNCFISSLKPPVFYSFPSNDNTGKLIIVIIIIFYLILFYHYTNKIIIVIISNFAVCCLFPSEHNNNFF